MPLNFITSFFGMNTNGMFLSQTENGTFVLSIAMLVIVMILIFVFWFKSKKE
ncbi:CorA family divalent cation transporter [Campylobacter sp. RM9328]|uniref:CorA family divalent cation transporter n=1 Tax=Campylobacter sp. RM9328 TaxID=1705720 RepID=UPI002016504A|nr:CorA family divalent cation transporter [Campylobacter sp. RM9328]